MAVKRVLSITKFQPAGIVASRAGSTANQVHCAALPARSDSVGRWPLPAGHGTAVQSDCTQYGNCTTSARAGAASNARNIPTTKTARPHDRRAKGTFRFGRTGCGLLLFCNIPSIHCPSSNRPIGAKAFKNDYPKSFFGFSTNKHIGFGASSGHQLPHICESTGDCRCRGHGW